jgi:HD-like signal output (HDOD) protein
MPIVPTSDLGGLKSASDDAARVAPTIGRAVSAERIARQLEAIGPLPQVAMEVMQLTEDPDSDSRDVERTVTRDPVMAAKVLKMANSAFFSKGQPCQTLQQASTRLGMKMVRNLVVSSCVTGMMRQPQVSYAYQPFGLSRHSLAHALLSTEVIAALGLPRALVDELFLDGLLHDAGKLVLDPVLGGPVTATGAAGIARERELAGTDHCAVGRIMAEHWKLPEHTAQAMSHHHDIHAAAPEFRQHAAVVALTDWLVNHYRCGLEDDVETHPLDGDVRKTLEVDEERVAALAEELNDPMAQILQFCSSVL